jgi:4-nitrophenyl phosphatase
MTITTERDCMQQPQGVIIDMDGVLWRGETVLPGMPDLFAFLRETHIPFVLATNNSGRHPEQYIEKLAGMGVEDITEEQIVTAGTATADYLREQYPEGTRLYVIGHDGLRRVLREAGFVLADSDVEAVVVGIDFEFNYALARHATLLIRQEGAAFIGTNPDVTFPSPDGLVPGAGSIIAMIEAAVEVEPTIIGKPAEGMFRVALERLGSDPSDTLMIGDRINTDIEGAQKQGIQTALLLTGVTTRDEAESHPQPPDAIYETLNDLLTGWKQG